MKLKELLSKYGYTSVALLLTLRQAQLAERNENYYNTMVREQKMEAEKAVDSVLEKEIEEEEFKSSLKTDAKNIQDKNNELETLKGNIQKNETPNDKEYYQNEYNKTLSLLEEREKIIESDEMLDKIQKSDISEIIMEIGNKFQSFLETLSSVQLAALFNLGMNYLLFSSAFTILSILLGDHLIERFKLETKYPRLAKLIKLKSKMNNYYKKIYFIIHFALILLTVLGNLFLFFMTYF